MTEPRRCGGTKGKPNYTSDEGKSGWHQYVERIQDGGCPANCKPCFGCSDCDPDHWCKCGTELCFGPPGGTHGERITCKQQPGEIPRHHFDGTPRTPACLEAEQAQAAPVPPLSREQVERKVRMAREQVGALEAMLLALYAQVSAQQARIEKLARALRKIATEPDAAFDRYGDKMDPDVRELARQALEP